MTAISKNISGVTFTIGAEAANVINVGLQIEGPSQGEAFDGTGGVILWLSDDTAGQTLATAPDTVAIGTDGTLVTIGTNLYFAICEVDGDIDIDITETLADTFYMNVLMPNGEVITSGAITFA